jgi:hypothetical protein
MALLTLARADPDQNKSQPLVFIVEFETERELLYYGEEDT